MLAFVHQLVLFHVLFSCGHHNSFSRTCLHCHNSKFSSNMAKVVFYKRYILQDFQEAPDSNFSAKRENCKRYVHVMNKYLRRSQKRKGGELPKVRIIADVSSDSPSSLLIRSDEGLSLETSAIIRTFGSSPPFRFWLLIYTAYAAPQLFGWYLWFS